MLRDILEELLKEKPANNEIAIIPVPVETTTLGFKKMVVMQPRHWEYIAVIYGM